jgi:hypothetical protein
MDEKDKVIAWGGKAMSFSLIVTLLCIFLLSCAHHGIISSEKHPANPAAPQAPAISGSGVLTIQFPTPDPIPPEMKEMQMERHQ